ncbi:hypothetical protein ABVF33_00715 [Candidatus Rickettsia barbariae]
MTTESKNTSLYQDTVVKPRYDTERVF